MATEYLQGTLSEVMANYRNEIDRAGDMSRIDVVVDGLADSFFQYMEGVKSDMGDIDYRVADLDDLIDQHGANEIDDVELADEIFRLFDDTFYDELGAGVNDDLERFTHEVEQGGSVSAAAKDLIGRLRWWSELADNTVYAMRDVDEYVQREATGLQSLIQTMDDDDVDDVEYMRDYAMNIADTVVDMIPHLMG